MRCLDSILVLSGLRPGRRRELERACEWRTYSPGTTILHYGDPGDFVAFLVDGRVRVRSYSATGRAVSYRDLGPGEVFGEFAAIDGGRRSASIEALETCEIALLAATIFRDVITTEATVAHALLVRSVALNRALTERVRELATLDVGERVASELLRRADGRHLNGGAAQIEPFPTHQEIADLIGTTREGVTKKLKHLERDGLIRRLGAHGYVVHVEQLKQWLADGGEDETTGDGRRFI